MRARSSRNGSDCETMTSDTKPTDYKSTVFLPRTDFAMRANLPEREPEILERWADMGLYAKLRATAKGRPKFVLHDGPPYANGNLHIGHALNKILKDVVNRSQQMLGKDATTCRAGTATACRSNGRSRSSTAPKGKDKDAVPIVEFRRECRDFADHWIGDAARGVQAPGRRGRLGQPLHDHDLRLRGPDRCARSASS